MVSNALAFPSNNIAAQRAGFATPQNNVMPVNQGTPGMGTVQTGTIARPVTGGPVMNNPVQTAGMQPQQAGNAVQNPAAQNFMRSRMMGLTQ